MMCGTCRTAGAVLAGGRRLNPGMWSPALLGRSVTQLAQELHSQCRYRDCTCQHLTAVVLAPAAEPGITGHGTPSA